MSVTWEYIYEATMARRSRDSPFVQRMIAVRDRVNCDIITPLPDVKGEPDVEAPMPSLVSDAIEHNAMRAGSIEPTRRFPYRYGVRARDVDGARARADIRKDAAAATRRHSNAKNLARRFYRHHYAYGTGSLIVTPDFTWRNLHGPMERDEAGRMVYGAGRARWELRDPLTTYPEHRSPDDMRAPLNCSYVYAKSPEWIAKTYGREFPEIRSMVTSGQSAYPWVDIWDLVEWVDEEWCVVGILGPRMNEGWDDARAAGITGTMLNRELYRYPNRCNGLVPVAAPRRVTLDRVAGAVGHLVNITDWIARLTALEVTAADRGVHPDLVAIPADGSEPIIIGGNWKAGRTGEINLLKGVSSVQVLHNQPNLLTRQLIDALEQNFSSSAGLLPQYQGQTTGALRTGRGIQTLTEVASDPRIMEMQDSWAIAEEVLTQCSFEMEKEMWPARKFVVFSGVGADPQETDYTPATDFDSTLCSARFDMPGTDIQTISVILPQRVGAKMLSRRSAMELDPLVPDADAEMQNIRAEQMEETVFAMLLQQAMAPESPISPIDYLEVAAEIDKGLPLVKAFELVQKRAQEAQAQAPPPPEAAPTPETMPGVLQPGMSNVPGGGAAPPTGPPPQARFQQLMAAAMARPTGRPGPQLPTPAGAPR